MSRLPCPSAPHRAVAGLLPVAAGLPAPEGLAADLAASPPKALAAIAASNRVHTVLATAFRAAPGLRRHIPGDLALYFDEMQRANTRRNAAGRDQLARIGTALAARGIEAVALKGAAELLAPAWPDPSQRFLSDLDLLVPEARLAEAEAVLRGLGGRQPATISELDAPGHHHVDPILFEGRRLPVELHRRVGSGPVAALLPAAEVIARSCPAGLPGLLVPCLADRVAHHVLHTQTSPPRHRLRELELRALLEHLHLGRAAGPEALAALGPRCARIGEGAALEGLDALAALVFGLPGPPGCGPGEAWARATLRRFGQPWRRRRTDLLRWAAHYAREAIRNPARRRRYLRILGDRDRRARLIAFHADRLSGLR